MPKIELIQGDCLEVMKSIPAGSLDMVLTDPPYGTTECKWDSVIPLEPMWEQLKRVIKPNGAIVMTAANPFTSILISSNVAMFKYTLVWRKSKISHFAQAPYRFLTEHEDIVVFSGGGTSKNANNRMVYNPQGLTDCNKVCKGKSHSDHRARRKTQDDYIQTKTGYPKSILDFKSDIAKNHPTQKPIALMEYLIKTYTNEDETVLDFTMGSGTTGVACKNLNRNFIGIELDPEYFKIAEARINAAENKPFSLFDA
jgi:site-specific DNA-methyltransferase (adenine-specific)